MSMDEIVISLLVLSVLLTAYQYQRRKQKIARKLKKMEENYNLIKARKRWK